ncbi:hypothetical protein ACFSM5_12200 [Lacibacterium aquatile]|uniref:PH domain-containing protein n=1 Tax=Lacibacterium aquatile TaxID=1168082 RepID=A0ABW5DRG9_9PROT
MKRKVYQNWTYALAGAGFAAFQLWQRQQLLLKAEYSCDPSLANGFIPKLCKEAATGLYGPVVVACLILGGVILSLVLRFPRLVLDERGGEIIPHPFKRQNFAWEEVRAIEPRKPVSGWFYWFSGTDKLLLRDGRTLDLGGPFFYGSFSMVDKIRRALSEAAPKGDYKIQTQNFLLSKWELIILLALSASHGLFALHAIYKSDIGDCLYLEGFGATAFKCLSPSSLLLISATVCIYFAMRHILRCDPGLTISSDHLVLRTRRVNCRIPWREIGAMDLTDWEFTWFEVGIPIHLRNGETLHIPSWGRLPKRLEAALLEAREVSKLQARDG